jgi:hypothetical protein
MSRDAESVCGFCRQAHVKNAELKYVDNSIAEVFDEVHTSFDNDNTGGEFCVIMQFGQLKLHIHCDRSRYTIGDMMELVKAETGLSPDMYYLVLNSRILHEGLTLKDVEATEIKLNVIMRGLGGSPKKKQKAVANKSDLIDDLMLEIDNLTRQVVVDNDPLVQEIIQYFTGVRQALQGREPAECFASYARLLSDTDLEKVSAIGMGNGNPDYKVDAIAKILFHGAFKSIRMKRDRLCVLESILSTIMKQIMIEKFFCDGSFNWTGENDSSFAKTMTRLIIDKAKAEATAMQT